MQHNVVAQVRDRLSLVRLAAPGARRSASAIAQTKHSRGPQIKQSM
jgi:hypothetical protein